MPDWRSLRKGKWLGRDCLTTVGAVLQFRADAVVPMHPLGNQVEMLHEKDGKEKTDPAHIESSVASALQPGMAPQREDGYPLQAPGMVDHGLPLGLDEATEPARGASSTNGRIAAEPSQGPDALQDQMVVGSQEGKGSANDATSTCSVLSTDRVKHYLGKRPRSRRTADDCLLCLERGHLDGIWICNRNASDKAPRIMSALVHGFKIVGAHVLLGNGEEAVLHIRRGRFFLMDGELVRVGDRLLHYGQTCTLVYQKMVEP
eukprot:TRINITY_DN112646_c0_g1_i1.p1 TRINITY_DN112646_c0_g1~~TRINITY_DN112646_c0_g1_i1.p1  ORF type:complete len:260 (-),score=7.04 TRINITY_DN112646_c0_g1_i1:290-1069(-)